MVKLCFKYKANGQNDLISLFYVLHSYVTQKYNE